MKKWFAKYKLFVLAIAVVLTAGIVVFTAVKPWQNDKTDENDGSEEDSFHVYQKEDKIIEDLGSPSDVGVMIVDCDDEFYFTSHEGFEVTHKKGEYVQGTGAMKVYSALQKYRIKGIFPEKDISAYEDGSVHISVYVNRKTELKGVFHIEIASGGINDVDELEWSVPASLLTEGWNDLYLSIADAKVTGNPDLTSINYWGMFMSETGALLRLNVDSIYASHTTGTSLTVDEYASTKTGYLLDFDSLEGIISSGKMKLATEAGEHKEGTGAVYVNQIKDVWVKANLKPVDISAYADGKISFWIYVNDAAYVSKASICVELSSSGMCDKNEIDWRIAGSNLSTGWNEITLSLSNAGKSGGEIDLSNVNFLRIYAGNTDSNLKVIVDAVRYSASQTVVPTNGMVLSCDNTNGLIVGSECTFSISDVRKEGSGSYQATGNKVGWWFINFTDRLDVSAYKDGSLHLWLYVDDVKSLDGNGVMHVELGSSGTCDQQECEWEIEAAALETGWNELYLYLEDATKTSDGGADLGRINWFRIFYKGSFKNDITVRLDDVRMSYVAKEEKESVPGMIYDCDSRVDVSLRTWSNDVSVTTADGEYKEGTGALKSTGTGDCWFRIVKNDAADISAYKDGGISFWLYVSETDLNKINGDIVVEISSSGKNDVEEYEWRRNTSVLKAGWNEVTLYFRDAQVTGGTPDLSQIDFMRVLYRGKYTGENGFTVLLDDIHAVEAKEGEAEKPGLIYNCDSIDGVDLRTWSNDVSVTTADGEYKEGTGALKSNGIGDCWFRIVKDAGADISAYKDGGISFWLYVSETDLNKISGDIVVEISSSGKNDVEEYEWRTNTSVLKAGWNEVTLYFRDAQVTGETPDLSWINFMRVLYRGKYTGENGFTVLLDDIHAVEAKEGEAEKPGLIYNCDSADGVDLRTWSNAVSVTTADGEYREGIGALISTGTGDCWFRIVKNAGADISAYKGGGISFWLYVSETDLKKISGDIVVEISSGGKEDVEEYEWRTNTSVLKAGWNEVILYFKDAKVTGETPDLSWINFMRVLYKGKYTGENGFTVLLDDIHAVEVEEEKLGLIYDCDNADGVDLRTWSNDVSVTTANGEYREGTGALKSTGTGNVWFRVVMEKAVDISAYKGGGISFWLYVAEQDLSAISGKFVVEISSSGKNDVQECEWQRNVSTLKAGWNEIILKFADDPDGNADLSKINFFRIWFSGAHTGNNFTAILDDVHAVEVEEKPGLIYNCDSADGVDLRTWSNAVSVTTADGEYREGIGALKSTGTGDCWFRIVKNSGADISAYKGGGISFWLYVSETELNKVNGDIVVEISSSGKNDVEEYEWRTNTSVLKAGWNEVTFYFKDAKVTGENPDLSQINFMRVIYKGSYTGGNSFTVLLDEIRGMEAKEEKPILFYGCDSADGVDLRTWSNAVSVTTADGEYKEGSGALKSTGTGDCWFRIVKNQPVDISAHQSGGISFWLYVSETELNKVNGDIVVEISSSGKNDVEEYEWRTNTSILKAGWNEVTLYFKDAKVTGETPDLSQINFMRVIYKGSYTGGNDFTAILDEIYGVK